ncbi:50S ribosomal protein L32 [Streptomyces xanthophaeus]|uniref:50S ribosomal protein L32 n=1 Tax=Streptomyces xanthophaeus TaxID=67385 RepID=UPI003723A81A
MGYVGHASTPSCRRAQWKATTPQHVPITVDGSVHQAPQRLVKAYERGLLRPEG